MRIAATMTTPDTVPSTPACTGHRDEQTLLAAVAGGDRAAAEELVDRTYRRVFATVARFCGGDAELAAELTQETYRRAWAGLGSFNQRAQLSTWLYRIAYTTWLNHLRRPQRPIPTESALLETVPDPEPGSEHRLVERERWQRLRKAVLDLPETLRTTVAARYWGELPVREIAVLEGISEVGIRKRLRKAIRMLSETLGEVTP